MSDRCYLELCCATKDAEKLIGFMGGGRVVDPKNDAEKDWCTVLVEEADYGNHDDLEEAAEAGLVFGGWHSAGDEYSAMLFAALDGKLYGCQSGQLGGMVVEVLFDENGNLSVYEPDLQAVQNYKKAHDKVREILGMTEDETP